MDHRSSIELLGNLLITYQQMCKPLCRKLQLPQTAFDILMFFANNPECHTAKDIVDMRGIKANLVSINVEKLVQEDLLKREFSKTDRRVVFLGCTKKASVIISEGKKIQKQYMEKLFVSVSEEEKEIFHNVVETMGHNVEQMMKGL